MGILAIKVATRLRPLARLVVKKAFGYKACQWWAVLGLNQ